MVRRRAPRPLPARARSRAVRHVQRAPARRLVLARAGGAGEHTPEGPLERVAGAVGTLALGALHLGVRAFDASFLPPRPARAQVAATRLRPVEAPSLGRELL